MAQAQKQQRRWKQWLRQFWTPEERAKDKPADGPEDKTVNDWLDDMVSASAKDQERWFPIYEDGRNYLLNNQLARQKRRLGWDRIQIDYMQPAVLQQMAIFAMQRPKIVIRPREKGDTEGAGAWQDLLQFEFERLKVKWLRSMAHVLGAMDGHYVAHVRWNEKPDGGWNDEEQRWQGEVEAQMVRNEYFVCDPEAESNAQKDIENCGTRRCVRVTWAKQQWPEFKELIDKGALEHDPATDSSRADTPFHISGASTHVALDGAAVQGEPGSAPPAVTEGRLARNIAFLMGDRERDTSSPEHEPTYVTVLSLWVKDRTEQTVEVEQPIPMDELIAGGQVVRGGEMMPYMVMATGLPYDNNAPLTRKVKVSRPKYPNGRYFLRFGTQQIAIDEPWEQKQWPFVIGTNIPLPFTWHGMNEVERCRTLQDRLNIVGAHEVNYVRNFADPKIAAERGAIADDPNNTEPEKHIANRPGAFWDLAPGSINHVQAVNPPSLSSTFFQIRANWVNELQDATGVNATFRGREATRAATATEISIMQTNSQMRTGLQNNGLDDWTVALMRVVAEQMRDHMEVGQMLRIIGEQDEAKVVEVTQRMIDAEFDITLEVGAALPYDKERDELKAQQIFNTIGMPYVKEYLEAMGVQNIEDVLTRIDFWQQYQQMLAQQEEAAKQQQEGAVQPAPEEGGMPPAPGEPAPEEMERVQPEPTAPVGGAFEEAEGATEEMETAGYGL